ncbi:MAG: hypothetical protein AB7H88_09580 [Vicinamibacterales bacterium]
MERRHRDVACVGCGQFSWWPFLLLVLIGLAEFVFLPTPRPAAAAPAAPAAVHGAPVPGSTGRPAAP